VLSGSGRKLLVAAMEKGKKKVFLLPNTPFIGGGDRGVVRGHGQADPVAVSDVVRQNRVTCRVARKI
jgi:hypothetical protein